MCNGEKKVSVGGCGDYVWDNLCCRESFFSIEFKVERLETVEKVEKSVGNMGDSEAAGRRSV